MFYSLYQEPNIDYWNKVARHVARYFRKTPVDELPHNNYDARDWLKNYFFELDWFAAYDLTEFIVHNHRTMTTIQHSGYPDFMHQVDVQRLIQLVNYVLEQELSGYRFIQEILTPISNKEEVEAIEASAAAAQNSGLRGAHHHIQSALELFGKKPTPDYRNAIKEAISAVESVAKQISEKDSATLDPALKKLSEKTDIHAALRSGFSKLYGYTSDEKGIRHALLDEPNVGFAEAKYMIVSCSAFVHYLIQKADAANLLRTK